MAYQDHAYTQYHQEVPLGSWNGYAYNQALPSGSYQSRSREYDAAHIPPHYAPDYDPYPASSSDYISQPKYSKSDYIAPHQPSSRHSRPTHDYDATRYSTSDYISPPVENRDDYISPECDTTDFQSSPEPYYQHGRDRNAYDGFYEPASPPRPSYDATYATSGDAKSNHRILKDAGFANKHEFMRAHGLKTWEPDDYDAENNILDESRRVDAREPRSPLVQPRNRHYSPDTSTEYDSDTYVNDTDNYTDTYTDEESIHQPYLSDFDTRNTSMPGRYVSSSPSPERYLSSSPDSHAAYSRPQSPPPYHAPPQYAPSPPTLHSRTHRHHAPSPPPPRAPIPPRYTSKSRSHSSAYSGSDFEIHGGSDMDSIDARRRSMSRSPAASPHVSPRHYGWASEQPEMYIGGFASDDGSESVCDSEGGTYRVGRGSEGYVSPGGSDGYVGSDVCSDGVGSGSDDDWGVSGGEVD